MLPDIKLPSQQVTLFGLKEINLILGKNGCGKSRTLRAISDLKINDKVVRYVPPERGQRIDYNAARERIYSSNTPANTRRGNEDFDFKSASFRDFIPVVVRHINFGSNFYTRSIEQINQILENIQVRLEDSSGPLGPEEKEKEKDYKLAFYEKGTDKAIPSIDLSSGEVELLLHWIEILRFLEKEASNQFGSILLLDEPDLHLHPDAQVKLATLIYDMVHEFNAGESNTEPSTKASKKTRLNKAQIIIATHSTTMLSALAEYKEVTVCFMKKNKDLRFISPSSDSKILSSVLPIFGAHPLTQTYQKKPILLVEGPDDEWMWNLLVRKGVVKLYPCQTGGTGEMNKYSVIVNEILESVYNEDAEAFLLTDKDRKRNFDKEEKQLNEDLEKRKISKDRITKLVLNCYAIENLCFTNEFLAFSGITWEAFCMAHPAFKKDDRYINKRPKQAHKQLMSFIYGQESKLNNQERTMAWPEALATVIAQETNKLNEVYKKIKLNFFDFPLLVKKHSILNYLGEDILYRLFKVHLKLQVIDSMSSAPNSFFIDVLLHIKRRKRQKRIFMTLWLLHIMEHKNQKNKFLL